MENFIFCPVLHNVIRFNITTTIIYSSKNFVINYLKIKIINKFLYNLQLLYFDRIDFLEGVDVSKTSKSKQYIICHYLFFLDKGFKFQPDVCNYVLKISMCLSDIGIQNIDYHCIISRISKGEAIILMQNIELTEKTENHKTKIYYQIQKWIKKF